ncbi:hypothetical protein [Streptomyces sp. NPDC048508]|uniref:hypothetical protein n=1 Tax=Streptomyces sp. NPDC048508 TaxID=3365561 RepID=UPI0037183928
MPAPTQPSPPVTEDGPAPPFDGLRVRARRISQKVRGAGRVLHDLSFDVAPGRCCCGRCARRARTAPPSC